MTNIKSVVLKELRAKEQRPTEILEALMMKNYTSLEIKQALSKLLEDQKIELTPTRILRIRK